MKTPIVGLHHVTAIASDPQRNLDFYTQVLGLRLVKRTINFDDPGTYHFYFGDDTGRPGTILTFFPWPDMRKGQPGSGETIATVFSIPAESLPFWKRQLASKGVETEEQLVFGANHLRFRDPDGMAIELVEHVEAQQAAVPRYADIPAKFAVQGFFGVTLLESNLAGTEEMLRTMGLKEIGKEDSRIRFAPSGSALGRIVDVVIDSSARPGQLGAGTVHHIAFRASDDKAQLDWRKELNAQASVTPVQDRTYFHSIYFREPGGVLFEIATDNPGFLIDEPIEALGERLCIPEWFEPQRAVIEGHVQPIELHKAVGDKATAAIGEVAS